jgi:Mrp family chromosome partitioning ATPase
MTENHTHDALLHEPRALPYVQQGTADDASGGSLWSVIDDRLRGRWLIASVIGVVLAAMLGAAGYLSAKPTYDSVAYIRIAPWISPVLRQIEETGMMPLYQSFMQTHVQLIASRRVLELAGRDETLAAHLPPDLTPGQKQTLLESGLEVRTQRGSELIAVRFTSESPRLAKVAVDAIVSAYAELYAIDRIGENIQVLQSHRRSLDADRADKQLQITNAISALGYSLGDLPELRRIRITRLDEIEQQIGVLNDWLSRLGEDGEDTGEDQHDEIPEPSEQDLDTFDTHLASLRAQWLALLNEFHRAQDRWHPSHPSYERVERDLKTAEARLTTYQAEVRTRWLVQAISARSAGSLQGPSRPDDVKAELASLRHRADMVREDLQALTIEQRQIEQYQNEIATIDATISEIRDRLKYLNIERESVRSGRITVEAEGNSPVAPTRDRRPKLAVLGVVGGFGLSLGAFFLLGSIDRRAFGASQLRSETGPALLGVLPDLRRSLPDEEGSAVAAHCIHQLRNQIEARRTAGAGGVVAVSSPFRGDGKTSIVTALGWSYASAGYRTALVDCDITGQGLTTQFDMAGREGLRELIRTGAQRAGLPVAGQPNLSVIPVGADDTLGPESLRRSDLERLFGQLRTEYDMVIVDTGPIPGSLEGLPVACAVDDIIVTMRRGRPRTLLDGCLESLQAIGAHCAGIVLNCAAASECVRYVSGASVAAPQSHHAPTEPGDESASEVVSTSALARAVESISRSKP